MPRDAKGRDLKSLTIVLFLTAAAIIVSVVLTHLLGG